MFTLLIKGTIVDAERGLVLRGFSDWLSQPKIVTTDSSFNTVRTACTVNVRDEDEPGVIRWFAESPGDPPFPVATLLHYSKRS